MKRRFVAVLLVLVSLFLTLPANAAIWTDIPFSGDGTDQSPYQIQTAEELFALAVLVNGGTEFRGTYFQQTKDIDLAGRDWTPIGAGMPDSYFKGIYDGGGHGIKRLVCSQETEAGLFGTLGGQILNLSIIGGSLQGEICGSIAARVGENAQCRIVNCSNTASVSGRIVGGIIGNTESNTFIASCWSDCAIEGDYADGITPSDCNLLGCATTWQNRMSERARTACEYLSSAELQSKEFTQRINRQLPLITRFVGVDTYTLCHWIYEDECVRLSSVHCMSRHLLDGEGNEEFPYLISSEQDLYIFAMMVASGMISEQYIYQTCDIDLAGADWEPIGDPNTGCCFYGIYDGGGHVINNLRCSDKKYAGLFAVLGGKVINLGLENVSISGKTCGAFAATASNARRAMILNAYSTGSIQGDVAGGIAGDFFNGDVRGCWSDCSLTGRTTAGIAPSGAHSVTFCATTAERYIASSTIFSKENIASVSKDALPGVTEMLNGSVIYSTNLSDIPAANFYTWQTEDGALTLSGAQFRLNWSVLRSLFATNRSKLVKLGVLGIAALGALFLLCVWLRREAKRRKQGVFAMLCEPLAALRRYFIERNNRKYIIAIAACIIAFFALYATLHFPLIALVRFVVFIVFYTLLPGYILSRRLCDYDNSASLWTLSSLASIALLLGEYIACSFLNDFRLLTLAGPILSCVSIYLLIRDRKSGLLCAKALRPELCFCVFSAAMVLLIFAIRAFMAPSPSLTGSVTMFKDSLYIAENSWALSKGLFASRVDMPGFPYRYHSVSNILQGCALRLCGISAVDVYMSFWTLFYVPLCCRALYALYFEYLHSVKRSILCILTTFFTAFFTFAIFHLFSLDALRQNLDMTMPGLWTYLLVYPNGIDIAVPAIVTAAFLALRVYKGKCSLPLAAILFTLLSFIATGAKATFGLCLLGALCGTLLLALLQGKKLKELKLPALLMLCCAVGLVVSYITFIYNPMPSSESSLSIFSLFAEKNTVRVSKLFELPTEILTFIGLPLGDTALAVLTLLLLPVSMFCLLPFTMPPYVIWMGAQLKRFKQISFESMLLGGVAFCGILALYLLVFNGSSQFYFIFAAFPFIQLLGFAWLADHHVGMKRGWRVVFALLLALGLFYPLNDVWLHLDISRSMISKIVSRSHTTIEPDYDRLTAAEYDAMIWLRENTPEDAMLAVNRQNLAYVPENVSLYENNEACYFYYGAYAQRHLFLGGYAYRSDTPQMREWLSNQYSINKAFFEPDTPNRAQLMRDNGVSYLVVSRLPTGHTVITDDSLTELFANRDIRIYGIAEITG